MKTLHLLWIITMTVAFAVVLSACGGKTKATPSQLDAPFENVTPSPISYATSTPWPTVKPTATRFPTQVPNQAPTAFPTLDRLESTAPSVEGAIPPGDWLYASFTDDQGQTHTLADYLGRGVILNTLSASCSECIAQQRMLSQAILDREAIHALPDSVFVALSVVRTDTGAQLKGALQRKLGDDWAGMDLVLSDATPAEAVFGVASQDLLDALAAAFGPEVNDPEYLTVIAVERDGYAHVLMTGLVDWHVLRDAISGYGNIPAGAE